jgi:serine phosphatase RsbU (regulator of sigma subunit)
MLAVIGSLAFLAAALSIIDIFLPQPYDGVILDPDRVQELVVSDIVPGSAAERAGIVPGDRIQGIGRNLLTSRQQAARLLRRVGSGSTVLYLVKDEAGRTRTMDVQLGERRMAKPSYAYACLLGFCFFLVGLFVLARQPRQRASRVFFLLCCFFLLLLVCRLRPASYSQIDALVFTTGTAALVLLPACFLHFFLIFPRPVERLEHWLQPSGRSHWVRFLTAVYLLPVLVLVAHYLVSALLEDPLPLVSGAPVVSWWILAAYMVLGLALLATNSRRLASPRERRGALLVLLGSVFGLLPFLIMVVAFPSLLHSDRFVYSGTAPLILVPLTFAYAIVRFQILDIRVILQKSLLYTATTAVITGVYALGIAFFNALFTGTSLATSRFFPLVLALAIVLLFEPLRRRIQGPVDRFFFSEQHRLQKAMVHLGRDLTARIDLGAVVRDLVEELPRHLGTDFAALYLAEERTLRRVAGPDEMPERLGLLPILESHMNRGRRAVWRLAELEPMAAQDRDLGLWVHRLRQRGVEVVGDLSSPRRRLGLVLLSAKKSQMDFEAAELELLGGLFSQAAVGLENSLLLEERTQQAELKRELEIASGIQSSLLPREVSLGEGWVAAAVCRPARDVGGDFIAQLPVNGAEGQAIVYGDVSGKSVPGALMMMAAYEILHSLAMTHPQPDRLLALANRRLYQLRHRSFVALGYLAAAGPNQPLRYTVAGQPSPLRRRVDGAVEELPAPLHRLPLGALDKGEYTILETTVDAGELILAYSDGVVDTRSPDGEFFGEARLRQCLALAPAEPAAAIPYLLQTLEDFAQGQAPYDDLTLVAIGRSKEGR